jgi:hypothetical protein
MPGSRMNNQPRRLIHHYERIIFVNYAEIDFFGFKHPVFWWGNGNRYDITGLQSVP